MTGDLQLDSRLVARASRSLACGLSRFVRIGGKEGAVNWSLLSLVVLFLFFFVVGPLIVPRDPNAQILADRLTRPLSAGDSGTFYLLGTDDVGRDILARIVAGGRLSLTIGLGGASLAAVVGLAVGIGAAYSPSWLESTFLRAIDVQIAFPFLLIAIAVVAVLGASWTTIIVTLGLTTWAPVSRLSHSRAKVLRMEPFVIASQMLGGSKLYAVFRHILPNIAGPVIVLWTFIVARTIIAESALSFLGLGLPPPAPTWGGMTSSGRPYLEVAPWVAVLPALIIVVVVVVINSVGRRLSEHYS